MSISQRLYTGEQVKLGEVQAAAKLGIEMYSLMLSAGQAVFDVLRGYYPDANDLLIVCGSGNNGGDGFVVAKLAKAAGLKVNVVLTVEASRLHGDAARAKDDWLSTGGKIRPVSGLPKCIADADLIVDGILGTGLSGQVRPDIGAIIDQINRSQKPVVSIDIPSGLCSDTGDLLGQTVKAQRTVTFIARKQGLVTGKARAVVGELHFSGLGVDHVFASLYPSNVWLLSASQSRDLVPVRSTLAHKGQHGRLLCLGGNLGYAGAIRMCAQAGVRSGAGLVSTLCHSSSSLALQVACPEVMVSSWDGDTEALAQAMADKSVIALGPGLGQDEWARAMFEVVTSSDTAKVLDADGLNLLAKQPCLDARRVITPHPGEAARLLGCSVEQVERDRYQSVTLLQQRYGGVVVLKGAGTLVCNGDSIAVCTAGNPGMASGGMGDVLTGVIAALMAQGLSDFDAACLGVYVHSVAADNLAKESGPIGLAASDLVPEIRAVLNYLSLTNSE